MHNLRRHNSSPILHFIYVYTQNARAGKSLAQTSGNSIEMCQENAPLSRTRRDLLYTKFALYI